MSGSQAAEFDRRQTLQPRIVGHLDGAPVGPEAGTLVEAERTRMIEAAGVDPEAARPMREGELDRARHQPAPGPLPHRLRCQSEIGELDVRRLAPVQLQQALVAAVDGQRVDLDQGVGDRRLRPRRPASPGG